MTSRHTTHLGAVLLATLAAAAVYGVLFAQVKAKNERVSELQNNIERAARDERVLATMKTLVAETKDVRAKLAGYRLAKKDAVSFLERLESLGRETRVRATIESVDTAPREGTDGAEELRVVARAEGAWQDVLRFIGLLELLPLESTVEQLLLSQKNVGMSGSSLWRGDVTLRVLHGRGS